MAARAAALALAATAAFSAATARAATAASAAACAAALAASIISSGEDADALAASAISRRRVARSPAEAGGDGSGSAAAASPVVATAVLSPASSRFRGGRWVFRSDGGGSISPADRGAQIISWSRGAGAGRREIEREQRRDQLNLCVHPRTGQVLARARG